MRSSDSIRRESLAGRDKLRTSRNPPLPQQDPASCLLVKLSPLPFWMSNNMDHSIGNLTFSDHPISHERENRRQKVLQKGGFSQQVTIGDEEHLTGRNPTSQEEGHLHLHLSFNDARRSSRLVLSVYTQFLLPHVVCAGWLLQLSSLPSLHLWDAGAVLTEGCTRDIHEGNVSRDALAGHKPPRSCWWRPHMLPGKPLLSLPILLLALPPPRCIADGSCLRQTCNLPSCGGLILTIHLSMINNWLQYHLLNPTQGTVKWLCSIIKLMVLNFRFCCMAAFIWFCSLIEWVSTGYWCEVTVFHSCRGTSLYYSFKRHL